MLEAGGQTVIEIASVRTGKVRAHHSPVGLWETATFKDGVDGKLAMGRLGLAGDEQADRVSHGGVDKAVLAYASEHYQLWKQELGIKEFGLGALGENLCLKGQDEVDVCLGDRYRIGTAIVEVSQPRQPCWKQARRWGVTDLVLKVVESGRTGWYLRIIEPGEVEAGDTLALIERPEPDWTVAKANDILHHRKQDREAMLALKEVPSLADAWKRSLDRRLKALG